MIRCCGSDSDRCSACERVEIRWPSGQVDRYQDLAADAGFLVTEGAHSPSR